MPSSSRKRRRDGIEIDPGKLTHFMNLRALNQTRLSARTGISTRVLRYYLSGNRRPRPRNFRRLYTALGCGPEDLLHGRPKREQAIDKHAHRKEIAMTSNLSPNEALNTLANLVKAAGWSGVVASTAGECIEVLRDHVEDSA